MIRRNNRAILILNDRQESVLSDVWYLTKNLHKNNIPNLNQSAPCYILNSRDTSSTKLQTFVLNTSFLQSSTGNNVVKHVETIKRDINWANSTAIDITTKCAKRQLACDYKKLQFTSGNILFFAFAMFQPLVLCI